MDNQYKLLSELLSDQAAFITYPKTSLANYWGALPPSVYRPGNLAHSMLIQMPESFDYRISHTHRDGGTHFNNSCHFQFICKCCLQG